MDPITAVAFAGNILQFIQFVGGLLDDTRKLYASATGASCTNEHLQDICGKLITFNEQLQQSPAPSSAPTGKVSKHAKPLTECAAACKRECEDLLRIMNKLKAVGSVGPRYWGSFRAALTEVWNSNDIEDLRSRIADRQRQMTLLLCAASKYVSCSLDPCRCCADLGNSERLQLLEDHVKQVGRGVWDILNDSRLDYMAAEIKSLKGRIRDEIQSLKDRESDRDEVSPATADYVNSLCSDLSKLSLESQVFERESQVLAALNYKDRPVRHINIPEAHTTTFKWSLRESTKTDAKYGKLHRWLKGGEALFWVSGKPGSGKSTFMKYIADSQVTKECLEAWAGTHELLVVSHYFTIYGTPLQRSLEGLLRSLVLGVLVRKPALIPKLLKDRWDRGSDQPRWTQSELEAVLKLLRTNIDDFSSKICFFIDGLDEFEGDHIDICQTLKQLSQNSCIKLCVSSRPWNVFEDALGNKSDSKLYMHELTHDDIRNYTESRLWGHPRWNILQNEASFVLSPSLVDEVVSKSNGVFLWVTLVVRLLREGLTNDDSISELQRRLSSFPADLKEFFRHIIRSVDPFYNEKMGGTLTLALKAQEPLCLEIFLFHDSEYTDENYAFKDWTDIMPSDLAHLNKLFDSVSRRINGRCKGLLERNGDRMAFLHRTVYDFLRTDEMSDFLGDLNKGRHDPTLSLLMAFLAWTKRSTFARKTLSGQESPAFEINGFVSRLRKGLQYARLADMQGQSSAALTAALLDNMEHSITRMISRGQVIMMDPSFAKDIFRQLVLEAGLGCYIRTKLAVDPKFLDSPYAERFQSPLYLILGPSCKLTAEDQQWVLARLLRDGHDPNRLCSDPRAVQKSHSPWVHLFVQTLEEHNKTPVVQTNWNHRNPSLVFEWHWADSLVADAENNILLELIEHGADPTIHVPITSVRHTMYEMPIWLVFLLAVARLHTSKRPEAYEETLVVMLSKTGPLGNITLINKKDIFNVAAYKNNFWDVCQLEFPLPIETSMVGADFLIRIFAHVLSKIPSRLEASEKAKNWVGMVLPADAVDKLASAIASRRSWTSVCLSKKRPAEDEPEGSVEKNKGEARATPKKQRELDQSA